MLSTSEEVKSQVHTSVENKSSGRISSIDVFRGLTIFAMIFVNDLAGVRDVPAWMKHVPPDQDGMTFVDVVFPAFLFIVGMAIPFAITKRFKSGYTNLQTVKHILVRTAGLLVLGVLMVNMGGFNPELAGMNKNLWIILVFTAAIIVWNSYPKKSTNEKYLIYAFRLFGVILLIVLAFLYRGGSADNVRWLQTSWWGILGLIGWAYLAASLVYLVFRNYPAALTASMFILILLYPAEKAGLFSDLYSDSSFLLIGMQVGSHASVVVSGILLSIVLTSKRFDSLKKRIYAMIIYAALLLITGILFQPLYGINKNLATPAWCFYSAFYCVIIFILLYIIIDHYKHERWSAVFKPAGTNPLLAYILPSIFYSLLTLIGVTFYSELGYGVIGIIRSLVFSFFILGITHLMTKLNIRLHL
jgi:heparan-alpha-glucosaminide N-acetyltransferase